MLVKLLKEISLKNILKSTLKNVKPTNSGVPITTVGVVVDETYFLDKENLVSLLLQNGIKAENISLIVYKDKVNKNEILEKPTFTYKDMSWKGDFSVAFVNDFTQTPFDLLISYYDLEKAPLLLITNKSKAAFKVGFSSIDKRLNHLMINTNAENYKVFIHELFRYLKILNKID